MWFGSSLSLDRRNCSFSLLSWVFYILTKLVDVLEAELWLWFKQGWTSFKSLCLCSGASGTAEHAAPELSEFMDQFTRLSQFMDQFTKLEPRLAFLSVVGLEAAVIQLLFGRGLLILGQLAGRWMEQLPAGRNFKLS